VHGLTGSARLLRDLYALDQHAFRTDERKLQLSETISLAQLDPFVFQQFRRTGVLPFATPTSLFDQRFPGHYLRLVRKVRVSVVALVPTTVGIRATLSSSGTSRAVVGRDRFERVAVSRGPELVALTSPNDASGVFTLDAQPEVLVPFEGIGVDTAWEFRMPRPANPISFDGIADVLVTIDYTALDSWALRQQVLRESDGILSADRAFSLRYRFPDAWYDLHNPEALVPAQQMVVRFTTNRADFPPHLTGIAIRNVLVYVAHDDSQSFTALPLRHLRFGSADTNTDQVSTDADGVVGVRRGNAPQSWRTWLGDEPFGTWELALPNTSAVRNRFTAGEINDILLVVTYEGVLPDWPS
jgi:hypothetical protein